MLGIPKLNYANKKYSAKCKLNESPGKNSLSKISQTAIPTVTPLDPRGSVIGREVISADSK